MPSKSKIKWAIVKDVQAGAAVLARSNMSAKQRSMKKEEQMEVMHEGYFGNQSTDVASVMLQLRAGEGPFAALFENDAKGRRILKADLTEFVAGDSTIISVDNHLTEDVLSRPNATDKKTKLSGRNLLDKADLAVRNGKIALSFVLTRLSKDIVKLGGENGETVVGYHSGKSFESYLLAVLSCMHNHINR